MKFGKYLNFCWQKKLDFDIVCVFKSNQVATVTPECNSEKTDPPKPMQVFYYSTIGNMISGCLIRFIRSKMNCVFSRPPVFPQYSANMHNKLNELCVSWITHISTIFTIFDNIHNKLNALCVFWATRKGGPKGVPKEIWMGPFGDQL